MLSLAACGSTASDTTAECYNGKFTGTYEEETGLNDKYSIPFRGGLVPEDAYGALANAKAKGVDLHGGMLFRE